jgi:predicted SAM-dependent methyltransferase
MSNTNSGPGDTGTLLKRLALWIFPKAFLRQLRFEMAMLGVRIRHGLAGRKAFGTNLLVNLGCGAAGKLGWINVDGAAADNVDVVYDMRRRVPLPSDSARGIFCEHLLEHLDYVDEVPRFIAECFRILQAGGVLRLVVPDAEKYLLAYAKGGWEDLSAVRALLAGRVDRFSACTFQTRMELINQVFHQGDQHKFAYDWETMENLLHKGGFKRVSRCGYQVGSSPELCIDKAERAPESLYVEAIK